MSGRPDPRYPFDQDDLVLDLVGFFSMVDVGGSVFRNDGPLSWIRCARCSSRSTIPSARVGSPIACESGRFGIQDLAQGVQAMTLQAMRSKRTEITSIGHTAY